MTATVVELAEYRSASQFRRKKLIRSAKSVFDPSLWPGSDYNEIGHHFRALADYVRRGQSPSHLVELLERYGATCFAIQGRVRAIEDRMIKAEKAIRSKAGFKRGPRTRT